MEWISRERLREIFCKNDEPIKEKRMKQVLIYDSTLRDGAQAEGITFSVQDKIKVLQALDRLGIPYVEAGNPSSNPKDIEFFELAKTLELKQTKLVAFGSTRHHGKTVEEDPYLASLLGAGTPAVAIFGKSWDFHVTDILQTTLGENINMIKETVAYCKKQNREVVFDAEHFFDGFKANPVYALECVNAALEGGADFVVLCDTNGGTMPFEIQSITEEVKHLFPAAEVGIHCHEDTGMAVASSIMAVQGGASMVQGTFLGFGERCGNANLCTIIANLQLKMGYTCIPKEKMEDLTVTARYMADVANLSLPEKEPYVGRSSFSHKGGMHIDGVNKNPRSFEHIQPESVGNSRRLLMSEMAGRSLLLRKLQKLAPELGKESDGTKRILEKLKSLEHAGYQFEGAESTYEMIVRKELGQYQSFFTIEDFKVIDEQVKEGEFSAYALVKINVGGKVQTTAAEGEGPINALDKALRSALEVFFPAIGKVHLSDYKVRVLDSEATASLVRVLIETTDGVQKWNTVGVSQNIIQASLNALVDSLEIKLIHDQEEARRAFR